MTTKQTRETLILELNQLLEQHGITYNHLLVHSNLHQLSSRGHPNNTNKAVLIEVINNFDYYFEQTKTLRELLPTHPRIMDYFTNLRTTVVSLITLAGGVTDAGKRFGLPWYTVNNIKHSDYIVHIEWFCKNGGFGTLWLDFDGVRYELTDNELLERAKRVLGHWIKDHVDGVSVFATHTALFLKGYYTTLNSGFLMHHKGFQINSIDKLLSIVYWLGGNATLTFGPYIEVGKFN